MLAHIARLPKSLSLRQAQRVNAAGMGPTEADAVREGVLRVKELAPVASKVEANRREFARVEQAEAEADRKAEKLEADELRLNASYALEDAREAMYASDSAASEILRIHDANPDVVSRERLSKPVWNLLKKRQATQHRQAVEGAEQEHAEAIRRAERDIEALRRECQNLPLSADRTAR